MNIKAYHTTVKLLFLPVIIAKVKAATGEEVSNEDLGGADLHCRLEQIFTELYI